MHVVFSQVNKVSQVPKRMPAIFIYPSFYVRSSALSPHIAGSFMQDTQLYSTSKGGSNRYVLGAYFGQVVVFPNTYVWIIFICTWGYIFSLPFSHSPSLAEGLGVRICWAPMSRELLCAARQDLPPHSPLGGEISGNALAAFFHSRSVTSLSWRLSVVSYLPLLRKIGWMTPPFVLVFMPIQVRHHSISFPAWVVWCAHGISDGLYLKSGVWVANWTHRVLVAETRFTHMTCA